MNVQQLHFVNNSWTAYSANTNFNAAKCQLVLAFGSPKQIIAPDAYGHLRGLYPAANIIFASTSGEIIDDSVYDETIVATAIEFERSTIQCSYTQVSEHANSFDTGAWLMNRLEKTGLKSVFVISDGTFINGSELVAGLNDNNPGLVPVSGGLAGDADRFSSTFTGINAIPSQGNVIAIGFYGDGLQVTHGSCGGWDEFGPSV
jgi:hypothetical protein